MRVLLVAASPALSGQVVTALAGLAGTGPVEVASPQRALALLDGPDTFDVVVADNDTHPAGGFFLAREMAARRAMGAPVPPVVLLVARHQDAWLASWSQASAHVVKPVDPFDLAEVVDAVVAGRDVPALPGVGAGTAEGPAAPASASRLPVSAGTAPAGAP